MCFDWLNWLKSVLPCITVLLRWLKTIFSLEEVIQTCKFCLLQLLGHICVDIQCGRNICVSQGILDDLDIYACFTHSCGEGMPQRMTAEMGEENGIVFFFHQYFIITVSDDPADGLIQRAMIERTAIPVQKDEVRVSINDNFTDDSQGLLIVPFHEKCFFNKLQHRNLSIAVRGLGGMHIEVTATLVIFISVIVIYQRVVYVNNAFFQVDIAPSQSRNLTDAQSGSKVLFFSPRLI